MPLPISLASSSDCSSLVSTTLFIGACSSSIRPYCKEMTDPDDLYPSWVSWCFDSQRRPVCPSLWDERDDCDAVDCPFAHDVESVYVHGTCALPLRLLQEDANVGELEEYLRMHSMLEGGTDSSPVVAEQTQSEQDEEDVRRIYKEMNEFEEEKSKDDSFKPVSVKPCSYFSETGNCLRRSTCPFSHEQSEEVFVEDVKSRWYPSGKDCECCGGFIYKCGKEACSRAGKCVAC